MDRVTFFRWLLAGSFIVGAVAWRVAGELGKAVQTHPLWVRVFDAAWFLTALWGAAVMLAAISDQTGPA